MSKYKRIAKFPLANKYSKKAVEKLIKAAGFIPDDMDDDGWVIPNGVGSTYYDQVFQVGTKYMIVAYRTLYLFILYLLHFFLKQFL